MSLQDGQVYDSLEALEAAVQDYLRKSPQVVFAKEQDKPIWRCSGYLFQACVADCIAVISGKQKEDNQWVLHAASMSMHETEAQQDDFYGCYAEDEDDYNDDAILDEELAIAPNSSQASCDSTTTMGAFQTGPATDFEQDDQHEEEISEEEEEEPKHSFHSTRGRRSYVPVSSSRTLPNPRLAPDHTSEQVEAQLADYDRRTVQGNFGISKVSQEMQLTSDISSLETACARHEIHTTKQENVGKFVQTISPPTNIHALCMIPEECETAESEEGQSSEAEGFLSASGVTIHSRLVSVDLRPHEHLDADRAAASTASMPDNAFRSNQYWMDREGMADTALSSDAMYPLWAVKQDYARSDAQGAIAPSSIYPSRTDETSHEAGECGAISNDTGVPPRRASVSEYLSSTPTLTMSSRTASVSSSVGDTAQDGGMIIPSVSESDSAALLAALDGCTDDVPSSDLASAATRTSSESLTVQQERAAPWEIEVDAAAEAERTSHLFKRYTWESPESRASSSRVTQNDSPGPSTLSQVSLSITAWDNLHQETTAASAVDMYEQYMEQPVKRQAPHHSAETIHQTEALISNSPEIFDFSAGVLADGVRARVVAHRKGDILDVSNSSSDSSTPRPSTTHKSFSSQVDVAGAATVPAGSVRPIDTLLKPDHHNRAILARQLDVDASDSDLSDLSDSEDANDDTVRQQLEEMHQLDPFINRKAIPIVKPTSAPLATVGRMSTSLSQSSATRSSRATSTRPKGVKREASPRLPQVERSIAASRSRKRKAASRSAEPSKAPRLENASVDIESAIVGAGFDYTDDCRGEDHQYAKSEDQEGEEPESDDDDCLMVVSSRG